MRGRNVGAAARRFLRVALATAPPVVAGILAAPASADRAFTPRFSINDTGNIAMIANTLETCPADPPGQTTCSQAQAGAAGSVLNNNDWTMQRIDADGSPATTLDSSSATLSLPAGATVLFAGLYYGAVTSAGTGGSSATAALRNSVKLRVPGSSSYTTLTAPVLDISTSSTDGRYQAFVDVTSQVATAGSGTYWVGDVQEATGKDRYGGWAIVIAYRDSTQPARNLTVFDGLQSVTQGTTGVSIPVSGFRTPPAGQVHTTLGIVAYEGDRGLTGDSLSLNTTTLSDASNPSDNFFNSSISSGGVNVTTKNPNYVNQLGFDALLVNADGVLATNATSADINLKTKSDQYFPGVVTFATELYAPNVQASKSVANITHPGGPNARGDTLRYTVSFTNNGQDGARDFLASDVIPAGATYVPNSLRLVSGPGAPASPTDASGDDIAAFNAIENRVVFRLGQGATAVRGGLLAAAGLAGNSTSFTFDVTIDSGLPVGSQITNEAAANFLSQSLATPLTATTPQVVTTVDAPDLTLTKSHSPQFVAGAATTFTLTVSNVGTLPTDGTPVNVTDNVLAGVAGFDLISVTSATGWACTIAAGTTNLSCTRSDPLAPGSSYPPIVVSALVHNPVSPTIQNTAAVSGGGDSDSTDNTATDVGAGTSAADLDVTKTVDQSFVPSGGEVSFELEVHNSGPSTAASATLDDTLGSAYSDVSVVSSQGTCTTAVHCDFGDLAAGATVTVTITATVTATDTTLTNTATVSSSTADPVSADNSATASFVVPPTSDLKLTKTVTANPAAPFPTAGVANGATYTLAIQNAGPDTAVNVHAVDPLPPSFTPNSVTAPGFTCVIQTDAAGAFVVACTRPTLGVADGTLTIAITGTFAASAAGTIVPNGARVDSNSLDIDPASAEDTINTLVSPAADLQLEKSAPQDAVAPGGTTNFVLTLVNNGPSAANATTISDTLPSGLTFVSGSPGCSAAAAVVTCTVGSLAPGATSTATITVQVAAAAAGQTLTNLATATSTTPDPDSANNQATTAIDVRLPAADLELSKTASAASVDPGGTVTFTLAVQNNGPDEAAAIQITDTLPAGLTFVSASPGCNSTGNTVTCDLGVLPDEATSTLTITAQVASAAAGQTLTNVASVSSSTPDPISPNNTASVEVDVGAAPAPPQPSPLPSPTTSQPDLVANKAASPTTIKVGDNVTFTIGVSNQGQGNATGVALTDALPAGLAVVSLPPDCIGTATITCTVGPLSAGASRSFQIVARAEAAAAGQSLVNHVIAAGDQPDPTPGNDTAQATVEVENVVDLAITVHAPKSGAVGETTIWTLDILNHGPGTATNVAVTGTPTGATVESARIVGVLRRAAQVGCRVGPPIECDLGTLGPGSEQTIEIGLRRDIPGRIELTGSVRANESETRLSNNHDQALLDLEELTTLAVDVTTRPQSAPSGSQIAFTIAIEDTGTHPADDLVISATPGTGLTFTTLGGAHLRGGHLSWQLARLAPHTTHRFHLRVRLRPAFGAPVLTSIVTVRGTNIHTLTVHASISVQASPPSTGVTG